MATPPEPREQPTLAAEDRFGQTLYRFLFFDWLDGHLRR